MTLKVINDKMKPVLVILLLLFPAFVTVSCKGGSAEKNEAIGTTGPLEQKRREVMAIHDEIMPQMGSIMKLKKQLKGKVAALDSADNRNKERLTSLKASIEQLELADEAMMQWMRTYKDPADTVSQQKAMEYLELKEREIHEVKEKMQESQANARALVNDN